MTRLNKLFPPAPWTEDQIRHFVGCVGGTVSLIAAVVAIAAVTFLKP